MEGIDDALWWDSVLEDLLTGCVHDAELRRHQYNRMRAQTGPYRVVMQRNIVCPRTTLRFLVLRNDLSQPEDSTRSYKPTM